MNVLQLISSSEMYGAERVLIELACHLRDNGEGVHVGALDHADAGEPAVLTEAAREGLPVVRFPCKGALDPTLSLRLRSFMRAQGVDILHAHNYKVDLYGYMACLGSGVIPVATCHSWLTVGLKLWLYEILDKAVLRGFPYVVGVSDFVLQEIRRSGIPFGRCTRIDNGMYVDRLDDPAFRAESRRALGVPDDRLVAVTVGRMDQFKAHHLQLQAMDMLRKQGIDLHLLLVGAGEREQELRRLRAELGLEDRVTFTGYLDDVRPALAAADLFVLSSKREGLPMVLLEAMGAGLPIVATEVGGIPEALAGGQVGELVPPEDVSALADGVAGLARQPEERRSLGQAARRRYETHYSREAMGNRYLQIYRRLLAEK